MTFQGNSQVFNLTDSVRGPACHACLYEVGLVHGLQFRFLRNWGEEHTLVCRLRVFGSA